MSLLDSVQALLQDPPPELAFEVTSAGIAMSRTRPPATPQFAALPPGALAPSPVKDNVLDAPAFAAAVRRLAPPASARGRRTAALILPDNCLRVAVLDFDKIPEKEEDRLGLIRFRMRKTLPFDIDEAALSYHVQAGNKVIAAVSPVDLIARYEAPFRAAGLHPGFVTASSVALLNLLPASGDESVLVAHRSPGSLTVLALRNGVVDLSRTLELTDGSEDEILTEISQDIFPTLVYIEDQTGARPAKLILAGFGEERESAAIRLSIELDLPAESMDAPHPGLAGYLASLSTSGSGVRKRAA